MKRNLKNSFFVLLGFFIIFTISSCNNIVIFKKTTQVSFNLDIQGLQATQQKQSGALTNRAAGGDVSQVIISLYQVTDPASISENQQLDISKLTLLESITPPVTSDGKVHATFNEVTVGISAAIFVEIYETDPADASQNLAYKGKSSVFTVQEGENTVEIQLQKIISTLAKLKTVLQSTNGEPIYIAGNFEINSTLEIDQPTTLIADTPTTFTRAKDFTGALFTYNADFTLQGSSNARITINGNNIQAAAPAIQTAENNPTANLTVTYCNFENNTNTSSDGGAIFVETSTTVNFSASNCNFTNNKVTGSNMAGGAVAINAANSTSTFDTCNFRTNTADQQGGGAVYISANSSAYSEQWHNFINCEFANNSSNASSQTGNYGGAIYFARGSFSLNNIAMNNNIWTQDNSNSDICADTTAVNLKLDGTVQINSLLVKNVPKNLAIADSFQTSSKIQISIDASSPTSLFKVLSYDKIGINNTETKSLSQEQIACFTSIVDSSGKQYTLNSDGTITAKN